MRYKILKSIYISYLRHKFPNITIGPRAKIDLNTKINIGKNRLIIEENVTLRSTQKGYHASMPFPSTILMDSETAYIKIGAYSRINGVYIHAQKKITIGKNCVIAAGVNILDSNGHILASLNRTIGRDTPKKINIGNNVWIGLNSIILKDTLIGDNSVVSAGSIVKGIFPPNSIISGNPARVIDTIKF